MAGLGFFGLLSSSLQITISSNFITAVNTTDPISVTATNTGGGTLSYLWKTKGISATINTPTASSTTVTFGGALGTSELYCDITNSVTGTTYSSPSCFITWSVSPPDAPTIGTSSSADKSFTINWSAPTYDGGTPITGYYVQNSTNNGVSWSGDVSLNNPSATSYNWFGNGIIFDGSAYIGRVAAVNAVGIGTYSTSSAPPRIPTFAAPTLNSFISIDPSTISPPPLTRPFQINFTPTACIDYYRTYIYLRNSFVEPSGNYYADVSGSFDNLYTDLSNSNQTTFQIPSIYNGTQFYTNGPSQEIFGYCRTFNNDGYSVDSSINNFTTIATQSGYTYNPPVLDASSTNAVFLYGTGVFTMNSNFTSQTAISASLPNINSLVTRMDISAQTQTFSNLYTITDPSRFFTVNYSFDTSATFQQVFNGLNPPYNDNSANVAQQTSVLLSTPVAYGNQPLIDGRIQCQGGPRNTNQYTFTNGRSISIRIRMFGQTRTPTNY